MAPRRETRLAATLVNAGLIDEQQMARVLAEHRRRGGPLPPIIVEMGFATSEAIARTIASALRVQLVELGEGFDVEPHLRSCVEVELAQHELVVPYALRDRGATVWVAMADPTDEDTLVKITQSSMKRVRPLVAPCDDLRDAVNRIYEIASTKLGAIEIDDVETPTDPMIITDVATDQTVKEVPAEEGTPAVPVPPPVGYTPAFGHPALAGLDQQGLERLRRLRESQRWLSHTLQVVLELCMEKGVIRLSEYKARSRNPGS